MGRSSGGPAGKLRVRVQANRLSIGEALAAAIQHFAGEPIVADTTDPTQVHRAAKAPDVVVIAGGRGDGSTRAAVRMARRRWPRTIVVALAETSRVEDGVALVRLGADTWLSPDEGLAALSTVLERISAGERVLLPPVALAQIASALGPGSAAEEDPARRLTSREEQVLSCFARGLTRAEIADLLGISPATVRTHVQNILAKLDVHSIQQAALVARTSAGSGAEAMPPT